MLPEPQAFQLPFSVFSWVRIRPVLTSISTTLFTLFSVFSWASNHSFHHTPKTMKILKFSTPTCGQCRMVSKQMKLSGIRFEEVDCTTDEGALAAGHFNISHVPCVLIINDDGTEHKRFANFPSILKALKAGELNIENNHSTLIDFP